MRSPGGLVRVRLFDPGLSRTLPILIPAWLQEKSIIWLQIQVYCLPTIATSMGKPGDYSDTDLLRALQTESVPDSAIRQLYLDCFEMASVYIRQNSGNQQDAEDIFQEVVITFIELVRERKFRAESSIRTFLYSITRHIWLNELKRRGRARGREEKFEKFRDPSEPDIIEYLADRAIRARLMQLIEELGEACKNILVAFYYDDLSMREIFAQTDYSSEQVLRNKKYKCMKQLEQMLTDEPTLAQYFKSGLYHE